VFVVTGEFHGIGAPPAGFLIFGHPSLKYNNWSERYLPQTFLELLAFLGCKFRANELGGLHSYTVACLLPVCTFLV